MPKKVEWLQGVFPALVTPFDRETEAVDEAAFRSLVRQVLPKVDGLVTSGTTGEFNYLDKEERKGLVEIAIAESAGKPVIAGCGSESTDSVIALMADAKEAGASAALVVTPYFLHPSDKGIYQHFHAITTEVDLPVILYNIPQVVDRSLPRQVIEDLADLPGIIGLKDSSANLAYMLEVLEFAGDRIDVMIGHDEVVLPALSCGVSGMILSSAQVFPEIWQRICRHVIRGEMAEARDCQRSVQKLSRIFARYGGGVAIKAALKMMGLDAGMPRKPLKSVGGNLMHETRAEIQLELEKLGKLETPDQEFAWPGGDLATRFVDLEISAAMVNEYSLGVGSGIAGEGTERAQVDLVTGSKQTPLGDAYALQLTYPLHGREALTTILEPGLTIKPSTLILPVLPQKNLRQANMIYGPTQWAVARAIVDAVEEGTIPPGRVEDVVMIALVTVDPRALERHVLSRNVLQAAQVAIQEAFSLDEPSTTERK